MSKARNTSAQSLVAAWEEMGSSHPLSRELQDFLLKSIAELKGKKVTMDPIAPSQSENEAALPPPERFNRNRNSTKGQSIAPAGPASIEVISMRPTQMLEDIDTTVSTPTGPVDESELAFATQKRSR